MNDLAALGRKFSSLPGLEAAVCGSDAGRPLGRVAGLLVGRVADAGSLPSWVALARTLTVRELREAVTAARRAAGSPVENEEMENGAGDRSLVRLVVPRPVVAVFDEALDLYRAVEGHEATVTSFVEALVAEALSYGEPSDPVDGAGLENLHRGESVAAEETALARSTHRWEHLSTAGASDWSLRLAGSTLDRFSELIGKPVPAGPVEGDARIRDLVRLENELETRLAVLMAGMADENAWRRLRFASVAHYAEERLGLGRSAAQMRVRTARALRRLPVVREAYERGEIGLEAAWLAATMIGHDGADAATQEAWVSRAREATVKRLRDERRLIVRSEAEGASRAGARSGDARRAPVSDAEWQESLRRDAGTARARVAALGRLAAISRGSDVFLRLTLPTDVAEDLLTAIESARRRLGSRAAWVGLLVLLDEFVETWDVDDGAPRRRGRRIFVRDGWRCMAPGCTSRRNLEEHHVTYRSRGGSDAESNRVTLCRFHHQRGEHGGLMTLRGRAPLDLIWSFGRDGCGGTFRNERRLNRNPGIASSRE